MNKISRSFLCFLAVFTILFTSIFSNSLVVYAAEESAATTTETAFIEWIFACFNCVWRPGNAVSLADIENDSVYSLQLDRMKHRLSFCYDSIISSLESVPASVPTSLLGSSDSVYALWAASAGGLNFAEGYPELWNVLNLVFSREIKSLYDMTYNSDNLTIEELSALPLVYVDSFAGGNGAIVSLGTYDIYYGFAVPASRLLYRELRIGERAVNSLNSLLTSYNISRSNYLLNVVEGRYNLYYNTFTVEDSSALSVLDFFSSYNSSEIKFSMSYSMTAPPASSAVLWRRFKLSDYNNEAAGSASLVSSTTLSPNTTYLTPDQSTAGSLVISPDVSIIRYYTQLTGGGSTSASVGVSSINYAKQLVVGDAVVWNEINETFASPVPGIYTIPSASDWSALLSGDASINTALSVDTSAGADAPIPDIPVFDYDRITNSIDANFNSLERLISGGDFSAGSSAVDSFADEDERLNEKIQTMWDENVLGALDDVMDKNQIIDEQTSVMTVSQLVGDFLSSYADVAAPLFLTLTLGSAAFLLGF